MYSSEFKDILQFAQALSVAVGSDFMSREHAKSIWLKTLKDLGLDVPKPESVVKKIDK